MERSTTAQSTCQERSARRGDLVRRQVEGLDATEWMTQCVSYEFRAVVAQRVAVQMHLCYLGAQRVKAILADAKEKQLGHNNDTYREEATAKTSQNVG
jgi:hypothetical protein